MDNNNQKLQNIAEKVLSKIPQDNDDNFGFVITILMIISITLTLIRVIQECNKTKCKQFSQNEKYAYLGSQVKEKALKRSWFTKRIIKKAIKKELSVDSYNKYGVALMNAILDTGESVTEDELNTLMEAANV